MMVDLLAGAMVALLGLLKVDLWDHLWVGLLVLMTAVWSDRNWAGA
jgi:hypothetical protein